MTNMLPVITHNEITVHIEIRSEWKMGFTFRLDDRDAVMDTVTLKAEIRLTPEQFEDKKS